MNFCYWIYFHLESNINPSKILSLGISVLRNSFVTWNPEDGSTFHNIITWKDLRASSLCHRFNKSAKLRALKIGAKMMYWLTGNQRYLAASILKFSNEMVIMRLLWALQNVASLQNAVNKNSAIFGTVDTWLIWKFTQGAVHATDPSNASVTGLYDPFTMSWSPLISSFFNIPLNILPTVMDSNACFGSVHSSCFGIEIPIRAVLGDQQAATFGENCFHLGDSKCTLGTGTFFNVNTHEKPYSSYGGLYPVVGWKLEGKKPIYLLEGSFADTGSLVNWAKNVQLFDKPEETAEMAKSLESSGEVFFLPPLPEMATSSDHPLASSTITGLKASSTRSHIVRALLEAIAFQVKIVINLVESEANLKLKCIWYVVLQRRFCIFVLLILAFFYSVNGGIANNDFVMQMVANLSETMVYRAENVEMSCLGAALLAGLTSGKFYKANTFNLAHN